ncbi:45017_t:CDS:2 [Gigaspora margarita]|uniref:45017_t:CDS:1 n=1 Tax=Gigaspora margarita TaxID=4874 RepID=A0ABN7W6D3_GIGMA|nr:45017_t:CDS:2 [Gigaspora margarita]
MASDDAIVKVIDVCFSYLDKKERDELNKLIEGRLKVYENRHYPLFDYVDFITKYSFHDVYNVGIFSWCNKYELGLISFTGGKNDLLKIINTASKKLWEIHFLRVSLNRGIYEDCEKVILRLIDAQHDLKKFYLEYNPASNKRFLSKIFIMLSLKFDNLHELVLHAVSFIWDNLIDLTRLSCLRILIVKYSLCLIEGEVKFGDNVLIELRELRLQDNNFIVDNFFLCIKYNSLEKLNLIVNEKQIISTDMGFIYCIHNNFIDIISLFLSYYSDDLLIIMADDDIYCVKDNQCILVNNFIKLKE